MRIRFASLRLAACVVCLSLFSAGVVGAADAYPSKPLTLIINAGAGGAVDQGIRTLVPYLEAELGVPVAPLNVPGGSGGWVAWNQLLAAPADGYTIAAANAHTFFAYLNKELKIGKTMHDFDLLCNQVSDSAIIAIRSDDERFAGVKDLKGLAAYLKNTNEEFLAGVNAAGSDDEMFFLKLCRAAGIENVIPLNSAGGVAETKASFFGGHVDFYVGNVGDAYTHYKNGEVKILCVAAEERSRFLPEIATCAEQGFKVYNGAFRNLVARPGLPPAVREKLLGCLKRAITNPKYVEAMMNLGFEVEYFDGKKLEDMMRDTEQSIMDITDLLGW